MSFQLKTGVRLTDLSPQMVLAALVVSSIFEKYHALCTVTSANDSKHSTKSWHYEGRALDFRTKDFHGNKEVLAMEIRTALGTEFDVVLEDLGGIQEHVHVEFDPK